MWVLVVIFSSECSNTKTEFMKGFQKDTGLRNLCISNLLKFNAPSEKRLVLHDDVYLHYDLHSDIHGYSKDELLNNIQEVQVHSNARTPIKFVGFVEYALV